MSAESLIFGALKAVRVVEREGFTMATYDPETGERTGQINVHEVAAELIDWLELCRKHGLTECLRCDPDLTQE